MPQPADNPGANNAGARQKYDRALKTLQDAQGRVETGRDRLARDESALTEAEADYKKAYDDYVASLQKPE